MLFNSGTDSLVDDVDFLCDTDSTSYPTADKTRNMNRHYYVAVTDILRSSSRWEFDDSNHASLAVITTDLVADQNEYQLASNVLKLQAVEVVDDSGNVRRLDEIDITDMRSTITDFEETSGLPRFYDTRGDFLYLEPAPASGDVTLSNGLKYYVSREIDAFETGDTTQEPGFAEPFHRIISLGAAIDWMMINGTQDKTDRIKNEYNELRVALREFYSDRNEDAPTRIRPAHSTRRYL